MPALQQLETYAGNAAALLNAGGGIACDSTGAFFKSFIDAMANPVQATGVEGGFVPTPAAPPCRCCGTSSGAPS